MKVSTGAVDTLMTIVQNEAKEASEEKVEMERWGFLGEMLLEGANGETLNMGNKDSVEKDGRGGGEGEEGESWDETKDCGDCYVGSFDDCKNKDRNGDDDDDDDSDEDDEERVVEMRYRALAMEKVLDRWATRAAIRRSNNSTVNLSGYNSDAGSTTSDDSVSSTVDVQDSKKARGGELGMICQTFKSMQNLLLGVSVHTSRGRYNKQAFAKTKPSAKSGRATVETRVQLAESVANIQNAAAVRDVVVAMSLREPSKKEAGSVTDTAVTPAGEIDGSDLSRPNEGSLVSEGNQALLRCTPGNSELHLHATLEGLSLSSVLPRGYGLPHAVSSTSLNRSRAFLLMDLGAVVRSHRTFHSFTAGPGVYNPNRSHQEMSHAAEIKWSLPSSYSSVMPALDNRDITVRQAVGVYIAPQFEVKKNRDIELLRLLTRLRVGLRCGSSDDIAAARQAISKEKAANRKGSNELYNEEKKDMDDELEFMACDETRNDGGEEDEEADAVMFDDVGRTRKPDGFFRRFLFASNTTEGSFGSDVKQCEFAVDSDVEVKRIGNTVRRLVARMKVNPGGTGAPIKYVLRLPRVDFGDSESKPAWLSLVKSVQEACVEEDAGLVGVSVDLSAWRRAVESEDHGHFTGSMPSDDILRRMCQDLRDIRLSFLAAGQTDMRVDMTGLPYPLTRETARSLTTALALIVSRPVSALELHMSPGVSSHLVDVMTSRVTYTADISEHLVAHAGALCTRIIGVKRGGGAENKQTTDAVSRQQEALNNVVADATEKEGKSNGTATVNHYYIDDGCYGSLSSTGAAKENTDATSVTTNPQAGRGFHPVPLYGNLAAMANALPALSSSPSFAFKSRTHGMALPAGPADYVSATVWGPTCDGLDRVCESVQLPSDLEANRDWLVFPQLGCGGFGGGLGLGTAFNGFDPPDTVYCVLGYFSGGSDGFGGTIAA